MANVWDGETGYNEIRTPNGGKVIKIQETSSSTDWLEFNVISGYNPHWEKIYGDCFTAYDGRDVKPLMGNKFTLTFSTYGITPDELGDIAEFILGHETFYLICDEFSGMVRCDVIAPELRNANFYGDFFATNITLAAAQLDGGSL
jgi:hypothetical protein